MLLLVMLKVCWLIIGIFIVSPPTSLAQQPIKLGAVLPRPTADCKLLIRGHGPSRTGPDTVQLRCMYPPEAAAALSGGAAALPPITIGIISSAARSVPQLTGVLGGYHAVMAAQAMSFQGVTVLNSSELPCQQSLEAVVAGGIPLYALMYFCGDSYSIRLMQPIVQHVWLDYDAGNSLWDTAVVAFGGSITADVVDGQIVNNNGGSVFITMQDAAVHVQGHAVFSNNFGNPGAGVWARGKSLLTVEGAVFDMNNSSDYGGAIAVMENATLIAHGVNFTRNIAKIGGRAVYAQGGAQVLVNNCVFSSNTAGVNWA
eukprot:gene2827-3120_t